ncbi:hypothetical protein FRAHR75_1580012 [Frankia sp. Hr75.2]|nr:hypothetical protein FRAHR75_1580012 [Frankia sp. Hr75.2]
MYDGWLNSVQPFAGVGPHAAASSS